MENMNDEKIKEIAEAIAQDDGTLILNIPAQTIIQILTVIRFYASGANDGGQTARDFMNQEVQLSL